MKTLLKDSLREIKNSFGRFLSIFLIIALGVGFFAGIKATSPDMKNTGHRHFKEYDLMDYWVLSNYGFNQEDVDSFKEVEAVEKINPTYSMDSLIKIGDESRVLKLMSYRENYSLNKPILKEGRLPEKNGEIVLEATDFFRKKYRLGDEIELSSGKEEDLSKDLRNQKFTLVGFANSPLHITFERGPSNIGNGKVFSLAYIYEDDFKLDYYTDLYLGLKTDLNSFSDEYKEFIDSKKPELESLSERRKLARYDDIKSQLDEKLKEGREELESERKKAEEELVQARSKLDNSLEEILTGEKDLRAGENRLESEYSSNKEKLAQKEKELLSQEKQLKKNKELFKLEEEKVLADLSLAQEELDKIPAGLKEIELKLGLLEKALEEAETDQEKAQIQEEIKHLRLEYESLEASYKAGSEEIKNAREELAVKRKELEEAGLKISQGQEAIRQGRVSLEEEIKRGRSRLAIEKRSLERAKDEIFKGEKDYETGVKTLERQLEKGEKDLKKLEREIEKLEDPDWYIIKRQETRDYIEFEMGADRIDSVAKVFPIFFLLIALLVCLTTMTRMVDEQRGYIGSLKSLGYGNFAIMSKYLIYSIVASLLGSIFGLLIGFWIFPTVIFNAYRIMFIMPEIDIEFNLYYGLISTLVAVVTTALAAYLAARRELKSNTAELLRPKAPKPGKRIFLEKIDFIWERLSFSQKVTQRNLFRYKKRLFMTVIGIAGCTALLLAGYGLMDSIMDITHNQFDLIDKYHMNIDIHQGLVNREKDPIVEFLREDKRIDSFILTYNKPLKIKNKGEEKDIDLVVAENRKELGDFIELRDRKAGQQLKLEKDSVLITEKMASLLDLKVGDSLSLVLDNKEYKLKLGGITENYAYHYIYMDEDLYESVFKDELEFNNIYVKNKSTEKDFEDKLSQELLDIEDVSAVFFITGLSKSLNDTMGSLNYVIIVLIVTAGCLAFVVLYNLTNINIGERMREIATIKVLGFHNREVSSYVYRENNILTILGTGLGLLMGIFLHRFIIYTVEIELIMFGQDIRPRSFIYSAILTILFSQLVNLVMFFRLRKIDMVESLKSMD